MSTTSLARPIGTQRHLALRAVIVAAIAFAAGLGASPLSQALTGATTANKPAPVTFDLAGFRQGERNAAFDAYQFRMQEHEPLR
jgi:hypothetical protein